MSKEKCITYNRYFLLFSGGASILFPMLNIPFITFFKTTPIEPIYELPAIISQVTTFSSSQPGSFNTLLQLAALIYIIGVVWVAILLFIKVGRLILLIKESDSLIQHTSYKIILTHGSMPSFSFYNYLFLNEVGKSKEELEAIMAHEKAHIKQNHSLDIILIEIYKIFFWFSPLSYQLAKAMRLNHEYLADYAVTKSIDKKHYINTLLKQIYTNTVLGMVHYFGMHNTEKRIKMIGKSINLKALYKPYFSIPFISIILFTFSCHNELTTLTPIKIGVKKAPLEFQGVIQDLKNRNSDRNYFFKLTSDVAFEKIIANDFNQYTIDYEAPLKGYNQGSYGIIYSFDKYRSLPPEIFSNRIYKLQEVTQIPTPLNGYEHILTAIDEYANSLVSVNKDKVIWVKFVVTTMGSTSYTNVTTDYTQMSASEAQEYGAIIKAVNATAKLWRVGKINNTPVNVALEIPVRLYKQ
ncbi:MAG: M56 family metallopeptidase [Cyclobacteriaceae bacterium]|nr:M56 family metallopeptidase [Cyclobacteriaceae bacterium]